jgi:hypothetical protein
MFADDGCMDGAGIDVELFAEDMTQALGIEERARADDASSRKT